MHVHCEGLRMDCKRFGMHHESLRIYHKEPGMDRKGLGMHLEEPGMHCQRPVMLYKGLRMDHKECWEHILKGAS